MEFLASLSLCMAVCLLIARALRQRGLLREVATAAPNRGGDLPNVAVIIPARNEADNIAACLQSLVAQTYPGDRLSIFAVDDSSFDGTPAIIAGFAEKFPHLSFLRSPVLEPGWTGKCQACWVGSRAVPAATEWLCFIDADMRAEPLLLASAVEAATAEGLDLLSLAPRHRLLSFAERLMIPCGHYVLAFRQNLLRLQARHGTDATVTGQFILVRRAVYEKVGGHAAVRGTISEDVALGCLLKRNGFVVLLMDGTRLISTRMYTGWNALRLGFGKNLIDMLEGPVSTLATATAAILLAWAAILLPIIDLIRCNAGSSGACLGSFLAIPASAASIGLHVAGALYFQIPLWYGLLFPLGYSVGAIIAVDSVRMRVTGRTRWKDRIYP